MARRGRATACAGRPHGSRGRRGPPRRSRRRPAPVLAFPRERRRSGLAGRRDGRAESTSGASGHGKGLGPLVRDPGQVDANVRAGDPEPSGRSSRWPGLAAHTTCPDHRDDVPRRRDGPARHPVRSKRRPVSSAQTLGACLRSCAALRLAAVSCSCSSEPCGSPAAPEGERAWVSPSRRGSIAVHEDDQTRVGASPRGGARGCGTRMRKQQQQQRGRGRVHRLLRRDELPERRGEQLRVRQLRAGQVRESGVERGQRLLDQHAELRVSERWQPLHLHALVELQHGGLQLCGVPRPVLRQSLRGLGRSGRGVGPALSLPDDDEEVPLTYRHVEVPAQPERQPFVRRGVVDRFRQGHCGV